MTVDAVLDDRNMPASSSGASASLAELDRLLFQVKTEHILARLGDLDLQWENGRYGTFNRSLKGGSIRADYPLLRGEATAVGGNNSFMTINFYGRDGDQGPYYLTDRLGRTGIAVAAGSEVVYLNGVKLKRGRRADYIVDYTHGTITFNPQHPIRSDSRIEVEYEYNDEGYPRYFYAASIGAPGRSTPGLTVEATAAVEGGDGENPLAFDWTDTWRNAAIGAGDNHLGAVVSGIDSIGVGKGDYIWNIIDGDTILVFSAPDSIGHPTGYLQVEFSLFPGGGYRREYDADLHAFYFHWVDADSGDWAPVRYLPLPEKASIATVNTGFNNDRLHVVGEVAISNYDRNTLSYLDDDDNNGAAWRWHGTWKPGDNRSLSLAASVRHEDEYFHPLSRSSEVDHQFRWDIADDTTRPETEFTAGLDFSPVERLGFAADAGYLERADIYQGRRYDLTGRWRPPYLNLTSRINWIEGDYPGEDRQSERTGLFGSIDRDRGGLRPSYSIRSEERKVSESNSDSPPSTRGHRYLEHQAGLGIKPSDRHDIHLNFAYRSDDDLNDSRIDHISDTRTVNADWNGQGYRWIRWSIDLLRYHQTYTDTLEPPVTATSAAFETVVSKPDSPWKLRVDYDLSSGSDRAGAQIASYVGEEQGDYRREGNRYVPDPDGDFNLYETLTDTLRRINRVHFTGQLNWSPRKRRRQQEQSEIYPLGITGLNSRFEADLRTTSVDPWRAFLLYPPEFTIGEAVYARRSWQEEIYFLEGHRGGDGKLSLQREVTRDRMTAGGEASTMDRITFRLRLKHDSGVRIQATPAWQHNLRSGIVFSETRSDVTSLGGDLGLTLRRPEDPVEYGLSYGYEQRSDRVSDIAVREQRLAPRLTWYIGHNGTARFEGGWRRLSSGTSLTPGYDLTQSWVIGDNWSLDIGLDYSLSADIVATASFRGLWRGDDRPNNSGLIEFTARL